MIFDVNEDPSTRDRLFADCNKKLQVRRNPAEKKVGVALLNKAQGDISLTVCILSDSAGGGGFDGSPSATISTQKRAINEHDTTHGGGMTYP